VSADDIDKTKAPLLEHLLELRMRLIRGLVALGAATVLCFAFADRIFNVLLVPYERARGKMAVELIFTAPHEYFFTQLKLALFGGLFIALPIILTEVWKFVAPGLYRNERRAALPFLVATPVLFLLGAAMVYFVIMPFALTFFLSFEQAGSAGEASIRLLPKVSEYLNLIMTLILAFGFCFELPVLLTLLGRVGIVSSEDLRRARRYAILGLAVVAAIVTPPDVLSMLSLLVPVLLLYEISIWLVRAIERRQGAMTGRAAGIAHGK
jgi:sec-independent protein translocase protein TatC